MSTSTWDIGDQITVVTTFTDTSGALADPTTVVCAHRKPSGTEVTGAAPTAHPSVGVYHYTLPVFDEVGPWAWRMKGTAGLIAAVEGVVTVRKTKFTSP